MLSPARLVVAIAATATLFTTVTADSSMHQSAAADASSPTINKPNIVLILLDDFGFNNVGYHAKANHDETVTPNMDELAHTGLVLDRMYTYKMCGPSRCSLQSGRLPVHVSMFNTPPEYLNVNDPVSGYAGIPRNMTCMAEKLQQAGYRTVMTGKWDAGMATPRHTPEGRGYQEFLGYFHHAVDYWTCGVSVAALGEVNICMNRFTDLWQNQGPAPSDLTSSGDIYVEDTFLTHTLNAIRSNPPNTPLFLFHAFHLIHTPLQIPESTLQQFTSYIDYPHRARYAAMVNYADVVIGKIVNELKQQNLWDNTLLVVLSDNGGPLYDPGSANNYPLRAGKYSDFEGGVRVNSFINGGALPIARRGKISTDLVHIADWYATFVHLANFGTGVSVPPKAEMNKLLYDADAASAGLAQVDSIDAWPVIIGMPSHPHRRTEIQISKVALISGHYKLVVGNQSQSMWTGPFYPNATGQQPIFPDFSRAQASFEFDCGKRGCLFDVFRDPTEHHDLAQSHAKIRAKMLTRLNKLNKSLFNPNRGQATFEACIVAMNKYGGVYGPFVDIGGI